MLSCKELSQQHASDHIDGQLKGGLRWSIRLHLVLCSHCRRFIKQLTGVKNLLQDSPNALQTNHLEQKDLVERLHRIHQP